MIEYKGTPLFGEGSSVSHTSEFFAIAGTVLFWLLFLIFSFVIKPHPKKKYKEVQIVLSSTPVVQKIEEASAPSEAASASAASAQSEPAQTQPVVETPPATAVKESPKPAPKKVDTPKQTAKKTETPKTQQNQNTKSSPVQKSESVEQILYQDPMEAFENQTKQKRNKEVDWDAMFDDEPELISPTGSRKKVNEENSFSDKYAGIKATEDNEKLTSSSSTSGSKSDEVSSSTSNALEEIKNSTLKGNAANGIQSETTAKTKANGSGRVEMEMSNGRSRTLINPTSPVINLSALAASTIDASKTVSITFKVLTSGNVTEIKISPESILTPIVRDEINAQISKWLFEADDYTATATFYYKIVKK